MRADARAERLAKGPKIKEWSKMEKDDKGEMKRVWYMTIDGIMVHETDPNISRRHRS